MAQMAPSFIELVCLSAIVLGSIGLGGGLYEMLLVDPMAFQPRDRSAESRRN
jgi:hypothetical protein